MFGLTTREFFFALFNGFLIGIANLIPGVSGGTFALVLGLYDRLIQATTNINLDTIKISLKFISSPHKRVSRVNFAEELRRIDAYFLASIFLGVMISVITGAKVIQFMLSHHPSPTLALFIGLIIPSLSVPWKMMEEKNAKTLPWMLPGIFLAIAPVFLIADSAGSENPIIGFFTGAIAISAMVLPGVSGSYIMLVLGEYQVILNKLSHLLEPSSILFLGAFALGCLGGLLAFTRLIRYLLEHKKSSTMSFLIGLILGSFFILWPFKDYTAGKEIQGRSGEVKRDIQIATAKNTAPSNTDDMIPVALATLLGLALGFGLNYVEKLKGPEYKEKHPYHPDHPGQEK
jgi:putative membrane protein